MLPQECFVEVVGVRLRYKFAGAGEPMLLLHGLAGSSANWRRNMASFAQDSTVYALDLFNMGGSARVAGLDASLAATADRLAATMDALGLGCADVAGHSHGGAVAMLFAARHPERVRRLILFAPANPFSRYGEGLLRFFRTRFGRRLAGTIPWLPRSWKAKFLARMYGDEHRVPEGALEGYTDGLSVPGTIEHLLQIVTLWHSDMRRLRQELDSMTQVPILLVWGDLDRAVSLRSGKELQRRLPKAELLILAGVGHIPFEEVPELVNPAVRAFLERTATETGGKIAPPSVA